MRAVGVGREDVNYPEAYQSECRPPRRDPESANYRSGSDLHNDACVHEIADAARIPLDLGIPLRVCEDRRDPELEQAVECGIERRRPPVVRRLDQQVPTTLRDRESTRILIREIGEERNVDLSSVENDQWNSMGAEVRLQSNHPVLHPLSRCRKVPANVRRRRHCAHSLKGSDARQSARLLVRPSTVIDVGEDVRVEVNHVP